MYTSCPAAPQTLLKELPLDLIIQLYNAGCRTPHAIWKLCVLVDRFNTDPRFKHKLNKSHYFQTAEYLQNHLGKNYKRIMEVLFEIIPCAIRGFVTNAYRALYDLKAVFVKIAPLAKYKPKKNSTTSPLTTYTIKASDVPHNPHPKLSSSDAYSFAVWKTQGASRYKEKTSGGRVYEVYGGLQGISRKGFVEIFGETGLIDYDMVSAHLNINRCIIGPNISSFLDVWCHDRALLCPDGVVTPEIKQDVLAVLNGRDIPRTSAGMLLKRDMPNIIARLRELGLVTGVWGRGSMFRILEQYERQLLDTMITASKELGCTAVVLKHDGFVINPHGKDPTAILQSLQATLHDCCPAFNGVTLAIKKIF